MDLESKVRKNKIVSMILGFVVITLCIVNIVSNKNNYFSVLYNEQKQINTLSDINNENRYYSINLKKSKQENYNIKYGESSINLYKINIDNKDVLVLLKENTIITDKVLLQEEKNEDILSLIYGKFKNKYYEKVLSNIDYESNKKEELTKLYIIIIVALISLLFTVINLFGVLNPKKTLMYKRYNKFEKSI